MKGLLKLIGAVLAVHFMTVANPVFADGVKAWNESEVLEIADELSSAARRLKIECRNSPPKYFDNMSWGHEERTIQHNQNGSLDIEATPCW